jgi:hypothetical protein
MDSWTHALQQSYNRVATEYAARIFDEFAHKPFDRALLDRFAELARPLGPSCDLGCGPGQVARLSLDFIIHERAEIEQRLVDEGFVVQESIERPPYPDVEYQSKRAYILARKPAPASS